MRLIESFKRLFSHRLTSILVLLLSIAGRVIQKLVFIGFDNDKCFQIQGTKSLLAGNGISTYEVFVSDLSHFLYTPIIKWPPGYSIFLSPFYAASGSDFLWGSLWLDLLATIGFVLLARLIILRFKIPIWLTNIYTLITGFYLYDFFSANSSDLLTLVFFQAALLFTMIFLSSPEKKLSHSIAIVLFLFLCCLIRNMYIPLVLVIPGYIIISGLANGDKTFIRRGLFILSALLILIVGQALIQKTINGSGLSIPPGETGFYPNNLFRVFPFLYAATVTMGPPASLFQMITGIEFNTLLDFIIFSHLCVFVILAIIYVKRLIKNKFRSITLLDHYLNITFFLTLCVIMVLAYLSISYAPLKATVGLPWTYIIESRYFAAPVFLVQLLFFVGIYTLYKSNKIRRGIWLASLLLLFASTIHGAAFTVKKLQGGNKNFLKKQQLVGLDSCRMLLHTFIEANPEKKIICSSNDPMFNQFVFLWENIPALYDSQKLNNMDLSTSVPVIVIVTINELVENNLNGFLNNSKKIFIGKVNQYRFYSIEISPSKTP